MALFDHMSTHRMEISGHGAGALIGGPPLHVAEISKPMRLGRVALLARADEVIE